ncbi:hypothetical protein F8M49_28485 [Rhodococcus zopfii]|uniref:Uncharacterized protein n=1 Tax=Rhodococcus zopfii TaxID=43772 RepID=A0ABU3WWI1_9NOCA|nr:hypothetical protein [Rhodococcus zopfii]
MIIVEYRDRPAGSAVEHPKAALSTQGRRIVVADDDAVRGMIEVPTSMRAVTATTPDVPEPEVV